MFFGPVWSCCNDSSVSHKGNPMQSKYSTDVRVLEDAQRVVYLNNCAFLLSVCFSADTRLSQIYVILISMSLCVLVRAVLVEVK